METRNSYAGNLYWKISHLLLSILSGALAFIDIPGFWSSYLFDVVFPVWLYVSLRSLYREKQAGGPIRPLPPEAALLAILAVGCFLETSQYFGLYKGHFDPLDYLAYVSVIVPCYLTDKWQLSKTRRETNPP